jgi:2-phosphoglycerate kinase
MYAFIGGTPAAGKSELAKKFIEESKLPLKYVEIDSLRKDFANNPELDKWVKFFSNKDEIKYWNNITKEAHLQNLISQSEAFWPGIVKKVKEIQTNYEHAIFEAVNLLPHLTRKDFNFPGLFLIQEDLDTLLQRLSKHPRWGKTEEEQELEAKHFINWEAQFIRDEAKKYNYPVFNNSNDALKELYKVFQLKS